jgi:hypothetical protein
MAITVKNFVFESNEFRLTRVHTGVFFNIKIAKRARRVAEVWTMIPFISTGIGTAWQAWAIGVFKVINWRTSDGWVGAICSIVIISNTIENIMIKSHKFRLAWTHTRFCFNIKIAKRARRIAEISSVLPLISSRRGTGWQARTIRILVIKDIRTSRGWIGAVRTIIGLTCTIDNVLIKFNEFRFTIINARLAQNIKVSKRAWGIAEKVSITPLVSSWIRTTWQAWTIRIFKVVNRWASGGRVGGVITITIQDIIFESNVFSITVTNTNSIKGIEISKRAGGIADKVSITPFITSWERTTWQAWAIGILEVPIVRASSSRIGTICSISMVRLTIAIDDIIFETNFFRLAGVHTDISQDVIISARTRRIAEVWSIVPFISSWIITAW